MRAPTLRQHLHTRSLALLAALFAAIWLFVELAEDMAEGETHGFDRAILLAFRNPAAEPLGPPWLQTVMRDITALGGLTVLGFVTLAVAGLLWAQSRRRSAGLLLLAIIGGQVFSHVAKAVFDRPRPDLVPHGTLVSSASFPSGHAMMAAVVWLTLAAMVTRVQPSRLVRVYLTALAIAVTVAVGFSRVWLGVHWPTDVLAGWAAGAAWALICRALAELLDPLPGPQPAAPTPAR
ncbi:phosphatase PAP2 family protein [Frigidibacter mobilis]|uniref:PA-phosphatase-related phosphoesterase n=1 Tax=Frigidibacter mobilis TaxID=1335048 RepID=A0A161GJ65_9RHOB|nr:phosphatase PAP2 family protein [Frigidibacter mobilis]AMY67803.1 PA-phosphatase-related phosphoesterase [Frigidibacter mobilis]